MIAGESPSPGHSGKMPWRPDRASKRAKVTQGFVRSLAGDGGKQARALLVCSQPPRTMKTRSVMLTTRATTWAAWIAAVLVLTASSMASAATGLLSPNSSQGKTALERGWHQESSAVSAEACRGCGEFCRFDAAGLFVAPNTIPNAARNLVAQAEARYPALAGRTQWHHTWPFEFGPPPDIYWRYWPNTVQLPAAYHQVITNEIRAGLRALGTNPTQAQLWELLQRVYTRFPINGFPSRGAGAW